MVVACCNYSRCSKTLLLILVELVILLKVVTGKWQMRHARVHINEIPITVRKDWLRQISTSSTSQVSSWSHNFTAVYNSCLADGDPVTWPAIRGPLRPNLSPITTTIVNSRGRCTRMIFSYYPVLDCSSRVASSRLLEISLRVERGSAIIITFGAAFSQRSSVD